MADSYESDSSTSRYYKSSSTTSNDYSRHNNSCSGRRCRNQCHHRIGHCKNMPESKIRYTSPKCINCHEHIFRKLKRKLYKDAGCRCYVDMRDQLHEKKQCSKKWKRSSSKCNCKNCSRHRFCTNGGMSESTDDERRVVTSSRRKRHCSRRRHSDQHQYRHRHRRHQFSSSSNKNSDHFGEEYLNTNIFESRCKRKGNMGSIVADAGVDAVADEGVGVTSTFKGQGCEDFQVHTPVNQKANISAEDTSWLSIGAFERPKPKLNDYSPNDISLGSPSYSVVPKKTRELDLNIAPDGENLVLEESSVPENVGNNEATIPGPSHDDAPLSSGEDKELVILDDSEKDERHNGYEIVDDDLGDEDMVLDQNEDGFCIVKKNSAEGSNLNEMVDSGKASPQHDMADCTLDPGHSTASSKHEMVDCIPDPQQNTLKTFNSESSKVAESLSQYSSTLGDDKRTATENQNEAPEKGNSCSREDAFTGFKPRKKRLFNKNEFKVIDPTEDEYTCQTPPVRKIVVQKANLFKLVTHKPRMWEDRKNCDLCHRGPSLSLGEWYTWCCGSRLDHCICKPEQISKLRSGMYTKKGNKARNVAWSGVVHKLCGLWSCEVFEEGEMLQGLLEAVKRGKSLTCTACQAYGATLGCRVKMCRRSYHYPCADKMANDLCCRMWDGVEVPIACLRHRYVTESCSNAKEKTPDLKKYRKCIFKKNGGQSAKGAAVSHAKKRTDETKSMDNVIEISSESDEGEPRVRRTSETLPRSDVLQNSKKNMNEDSYEEVYYKGFKLLCTDISEGCEVKLIPCTNDIDSDSLPSFKYISKNRHSSKTKQIYESLHRDTRKMPPVCGGCDAASIDDPSKEPSVHVRVSGLQRHDDARFDWHGQPMFGRLAYDELGRLQLSSKTKDILECNSLCPCAEFSCLNKELQKGIRLPLEVFKTTNRGWGVRAMDQIPRGKFVAEYVGEVITYGEAIERQSKCDSSYLSYVFRMDHPELSMEDMLVIDASAMSNVSRFINHSCDGNLGAYRVYTGTVDPGLYRIGLFAMRDIEIGEELTFDYHLGLRKEPVKDNLIEDPASIKCLCESSNCRKQLCSGKWMLRVR